MLTSCATLNTSGMSEPCRNLYNACLNLCPGASTRNPPGTNLNTQRLQIDVASCTNDCNGRAKQCQ